MENLLITGSNGFLGSHLIDWCINKNIKIYALDRPSASFRNLIRYTAGKEFFTKKAKDTILGERILLKSTNDNLLFLECDLKNSELLGKIIRGIEPDYIFHFGAQPNIIKSWEDPVNTFETNVIGTLNLFEPIKKYNIKSRVVLACSATEFGTTTHIGRPLKESDPLMAIHPYGISKIAAELLARQYFINFGIEIVNLRFFNITGLRTTNDVASDFIRNIAQIELGLKDPVIDVGNLNPYRDILGITDAIKAIWLAATNGTPGETYHICTNQKIQIRKILEIVLSFSQKKIKVVENAPYKLRKTDEDIIIGDNSKIQSELGWSPKIPIDQTLREMFDYWMEFYQKNQK
ncbi:MAG: GDP-mannose 4,6-dehydratase [Candidatus Lokiarchaeota archaeon]|nr:GDP-mannose 4,6-dehydratase [Candidatus Lokiarchaeota archaeon]